MRYRALSDDGDYTFGQGSANFLVNTPAAVGQAVETRLGLMRGEWFLDETDGTPYATEILGTNTSPTYDQAIRERILGTQASDGTPLVKRIIAYASQFVNDFPKRKLSVQATIDTIYGEVAISQVFP